MKILDKFSVNEISEILYSSDSFREFLLKIGSSTNGSSAYISIKKQLFDLNIILPKFEYKKRKLSSAKVSIDDDKVFIRNSTLSRGNIKKRILKSNLIEYKCNSCENDGMWNGKKLSLQLEHKNGISDDNRIENLEFLCPNCHTQTGTYGGKKIKNIKKCKCGGIIYKDSINCINCNSIKNRKVKIRPSYDDLINDIKNIGYLSTGKKYNVSDNSIRKWVRKYESESTS